MLRLKLGGITIEIIEKGFCCFDAFATCHLKVVVYLGVGHLGFKFGGFLLVLLALCLVLGGFFGLRLEVCDLFLEICYLFVVALLVDAGLSVRVLYILIGDLSSGGAVSVFSCCSSAAGVVSVFSSVDFSSSAPRSVPFVLGLFSRFSAFIRWVFCAKARRKI